MMSHRRILESHGRRRPARPPSRAFALPMVLIVSSLLLTLTVFVWQANHDDLPRMLLNLGRVQARFVALGGLQHALLKIRVLPTEAYDAAAYAVGKNPYFDHSAGPGGGYDQLSRVTVAAAGIDPMEVRGPAFFAGTAATVQFLGGPIVYVNSMPQDVDLDGTVDAQDHVGGNAGAPFICEQLLQEYASDITTDPITTNPTTLPVIFRQATTDPVTGMNDPFDAAYSVAQIRVVALGGGHRYKEEGIRLQINAQINGRFMDHGQMTDHTYIAQIDQTERVTRVAQ